jgi:hypothetical protein
MNKSTVHPFTNTVRLLLLAMLVFALTLGTGQRAQAAKTASGLAPVDLGTAANFVILSKAGISNVPTSAIVGDMGVSPIKATAITGFDLVMDSTGTFSRSPQVTGKIYASDYASPTPAKLTTAVSDMEAAYTDAAARPANFTELYSGNLSGQTLVPGVYKWSNTVLIDSGSTVTLAGGKNAVWIFQIAGNLTLGSGATVVLSGGAQAKNIFWQVAGVADIGTTAHMEGTILAKTAVTMESLASLNGRALAQTDVTLISNTVVIPGSSISHGKK